MERFGNRELSVVMMQDTQANRATLDDGNTRRLRRYWVGYTTPSQLTPSTKVEAMSPEHFIRTYDRVR